MAEQATNRSIEDQLKSLSHRVRDLEVREVVASPNPCAIAGWNPPVTPTSQTWVAAGTEFRPVFNTFLVNTLGAAQGINGISSPFVGLMLPSGVADAMYQVAFSDLNVTVGFPSNVYDLQVEWKFGQIGPAGNDFYTVVRQHAVLVESDTSVGSFAVHLNVESLIYAGAGESVFVQARFQGRNGAGVLTDANVVTTSDFGVNELNTQLKVVRVAA